MPSQLLTVDGIFLAKIWILKQVQNDEQ